MRLRFQRRWAVAVAVIAALALTLASAAGAASYIYWWQRNMTPSDRGADSVTARNHIYNELYFGPNAGWRSEVWEVTPAGYRHFDKWCAGNCFNAHPGYYYTYSYCANRDGSTHFVYDCRDQW